MEVNRTLVACLPDYQEFMRGVDISDHRMSYLCGKKVQDQVVEEIFSYLLEACC